MHLYNLLRLNDVMKVYCLVVALSCFSSFSLSYLMIKKDRSERQIAASSSSLPANQQQLDENQIYADNNNNDDELSNQQNLLEQAIKCAYVNSLLNLPNNKCPQYSNNDDNNFVRAYRRDRKSSVPAAATTTMPTIEDIIDKVEDTLIRDRNFARRFIENYPDGSRSETLENFNSKLMSEQTNTNLIDDDDQQFKQKLREKEDAREEEEEAAITSEKENKDNDDDNNYPYRSTNNKDNSNNNKEFSKNWRQKENNIEQVKENSKQFIHNDNNNNNKNSKILSVSFHRRNSPKLHLAPTSSTEKGSGKGNNNSTAPERRVRFNNNQYRKFDLMNGTAHQSIYSTRSPLMNRVTKAVDSTSASASSSTSQARNSYYKKNNNNYIIDSDGGYVRSQRQQQQAYLSNQTTTMLLNNNAIDSMELSVGCHKRLYSFRATKTDGFGGRCTGIVNAAICQGSCETGQISDYVFPHKKSVHKVCTHGIRIKRKVLLTDCNVDDPNLKIYSYVDAGSCVCKSCTSATTTCLGSPTRPRLPELVHNTSNENYQQQQQQTNYGGGGGTGNGNEDDDSPPYFATTSELIY